MQPCPRGPGKTLDGEREGISRHKNLNEGIKLTLFIAKVIVFIENPEGKEKDPWTG